jgi:hypothetical protein
MKVEAVPLVLDDPSPSSLVAWLVPFVLTLLAQGPLAATFLLKRVAGDELAAPSAQVSVHQGCSRRGK